MDTWSAAAVARALDTTVPRVVRAAERLGLDARPPGRNRWQLTPAMVRRLADELGTVPRVEGLREPEIRSLAALARAPFGLASARRVAGEAGISPTAAGRALRALEDKGLIYREPATIAAGRARRVELIHANRRAERWLELAPLLASVKPPRRKRPPERAVPPRLRHLFWNTAPSQLRTRAAGPYIARRLLQTFDFDGLAWGAEHLRASDWEKAAGARGLDARLRGLALNLAGRG